MSKLSPEQRKKIYETTQKILKGFDWFISWIVKIYDGPVERKKRDFRLKYNEEMTDDEVRYFRFQLTIVWVVIITILVIAIYIIL